MPLPAWMTPAAARQVAVLPGQLAAESLLFHAWLEEHYQDYDALATNVRLGQGEDPGPQFPDFSRRYAILTTQKRADLVLAHGRDVTIAEVKIQANLSELGQLLGYRTLWQREFPDWPVVRLLVIAHHLTVDTAAALLHAGVAYELFPDVQLPELVTLPPAG